MINTYNLFTVRVSHGKLPIPIDIYKKVLKFVEENYKTEDNISCVSGFQYHETFEGKKDLNQFINNYLNNVYYVKIIHSWLNVLENNSYNKPHSHTGDGIKYAGVLYLSDANNNIIFSKNSEVFEVKPKLFDYLIFPFDLLHYVLPEKRKEKRICYAFNLSAVD